MRSQFFTFLYINVCSWRSAEGAAPLPAPRNRAGQARGGRARRRGRPSRCLPLSPPPPGPARPSRPAAPARPRPPLAPLGPSPPAERRRAGRRLPPPSRRGSYTGSRPGSPPSPGSSAPPPAPRRGPAGPARPFAVTLPGARPTRPGPPRKAAGGPGLLWGGGVGFGRRRWFLYKFNDYFSPNCGLCRPQDHLTFPSPLRCGLPATSEL